MIKRIVCILIITLIVLAGFIYGEVAIHKDNDTVKANVVSTDNVIEQGVEKQYVKAVIVEGENKGKTVNINRTIIKYSKNDFKLNKGNEIYVRLNSNNENASLVYVSREKPITILAIIFVAILLLFGLSKGFRAAISLFFSGLIIIKVFIPLVIQGKNPISLGIVVSMIIVIISFIIISGINKKSLSAILGTIAGTITAGLFAAYFGKISCISGVTDEYTQFLVTELGIQINFKGLLFAGILLGSVGAVMDVSMSITSVIYEFKNENKRLSFTKLLTVGLRVGKDIIATMVNTLILAYAGVSLPMFVLYGFMDMNVTDIINMESITVEVIRSLCGSIGLILTIPFTSLIAAHMASKKS